MSGSGYSRSLTRKGLAKELRKGLILRTEHKILFKFTTSVNEQDFPAEREASMTTKDYLRL